MTVAELLKCCGSTRWAEAMVAGGPFANGGDLFSHAERIWWKLEPADWLEAFQAHPKIGERNPVSGWAAQEQAGVNAADPLTVEALARANEEYLAQLGYIFIVCATGKSGEEMLSLLQSRMNNDPGEELRIAAGEQSKITRLRLEKLLAS